MSYANSSKYSTIQCYNIVVNERLKKKNIALGYEKGFNNYVLNLIIEFYNIKANKKYAYDHKIGNTKSFTYSQQFIEFIVSEIRKNPQKFVDSLKKSTKK